MKLVRNIVVIVVALLIFVFFFAGQGVFDDVLPVLQVKGAVLLAVKSEDFVDNGKYGYMVRGGEEDRLLEEMASRGYTFQQRDEEELVFLKDGKRVLFVAEDFLGCLLIREE